MRPYALRSNVQSPCQSRHNCFVQRRFRKHERNRDVEILDERFQKSDYVCLSDFPLPMTPWYDTEEFDEVMSIINSQIVEVPKESRSRYHFKGDKVLFVPDENVEGVQFALLKVRTWKIRSRNLVDAKFLTEFLTCLERLLDYLLKKNSVASDNNFVDQKVFIITAFISSLDSLLLHPFFSSSGYKGREIFGCPYWIPQIRNKASHSNERMSSEVLEDGVTFVYQWFRKHFVFHLLRMQNNASNHSEFRSHRSFSKKDFDHVKFFSDIVELMLDKLDDSTEVLATVRHFYRYDGNLFTTSFVKIIHSIMLVRTNADFKTFAPKIQLICKQIFHHNPNSSDFVLNFFNIFLDRMATLEAAIQAETDDLKKNTSKIAYGRLYKFMSDMMHRIIKRDSKNKNERDFFQIYPNCGASYSMKWHKFLQRLILDIKQLFPTTFSMIRDTMFLVHEPWMNITEKNRLLRSLRENHLKLFPKEISNLEEGEILD